ncbi:uncharacterized protein PAC_14872 [Phialocephala subalpina]|uniref:Uncharacterized protein n=1 Tax=Phialocephala subalpina TaxID=576137 RepID=A0A1L7XIV4_9HELO|nr:uncharacterized protein PAC_14872 [Phialocephala subalpina]
MGKAEEDTHDIMESEDLDASDYDSSARESLDERHDNLHENTLCLPRQNLFVKNESYRFFLFHAVLDQVLSVDAYKKISWVKIAKKDKTSSAELELNSGSDLGLDLDLHLDMGLDSNSESESVFSYCSTKHVNLLLAIIDALAAVKLGQSTESRARQIFDTLWEKYMKIHYPDLIPQKKISRAEKMDEWVADMHSFDNGDDDEEPSPPYKKHDSSKSKTEQQNTELDPEMTDLLPKVGGDDVVAEESETEEEDTGAEGREEV